MAQCLDRSKAYLQFRSRLGATSRARRSGSAMNFMLTSDRRFAFGEATYPNGGVFGPVQGSYISLFVIHEGQAVVEVDEREIVLAGGQCCLVLNIRRLALRCERGVSTRVS